MTIKMVAAKDFRGKRGEGKGDDKRMVEAGDEITVSDQSRADYLERMEMAYPAGSNKLDTKKEKVARNKMEKDARSNKSDRRAEGKPLTSAKTPRGGQGGAAGPSSSSRVGRRSAAKRSGGSGGSSKS